MLPTLAPDIVGIQSVEQTYKAGVFTLDQHVVITYKDRRVTADHIEYDSDSADLTLTGHVVVIGGANDERIAASHGTYNLKTYTGRFYDVSGSVGIAVRPTTSRSVYTNGNPFLFTGRIVVKTGPHDYDIYDGTLTSCQLPKPDWLLSSDHFILDEDKARARNSTFRLLNIPILFLPYVTHPTDADERESGILIPTIGQSTTKGVTLGEQVYVVLNRSADLTVGADYYSSIGYAQMATLRLRGANIDFLNLHYSGVLDRRTGLNAQGQPNNQGGEEVVLAGRHDFTPYTRAAANVDYLSSYVYREAFADNFNQAVNSDIVSTAYLTHVVNGHELAGMADRYQGIKTLAQPANGRRPATPQAEVHIFHAPTILYDTTDERVRGTATPFSTGLELNLNASASGLKRSQPNFVTGGTVERFDVRPEASYPISLGGSAEPWHLLPTAAVRETLYTRSRVNTAPGQPPAESTAGLARSAFEFSLGVRPPVVERTFTPPARFARVFGAELRHTLAPEVTYRLTKGINNFASVLRFDPVDVVSDTNELEYGITQRLYRRPRRTTSRTGTPCATQQVSNSPGFNSALDAGDNSGTESADDIMQQPATELPAFTGACPAEDFISWRLTQKSFFDQSFGGAVVNSRRNLFTTTLELSGVAFLTEPRAISPLISRLRVRTSAHTDVEWDFDLDTGAKRFTSSNVYIDLHQGLSFAALSYARLDAPGRFFTQNPTPTPGSALSDGVTSSVSDFNQLRVLLGYGSPTKPGLSVASNIGLDLKSLYGATSVSNVTSGGVTRSTSITVYPALLQYAAVQSSYNWNCCGLAIEYRKFELGSVRNEGTYKFSFTLANIGAAGNLRRAERLF